MPLDARYAEIAFDFVEAVQDLSNADAVLAKLNGAAEQLGFSFFIMTGLPLPNRPLEPLVIRSAWPTGWFDRYIERDYFRLDPVGRHVLTSSLPFRWYDAPLLRGASGPAGTVMQEARAFGLTDGFCVPIHSANGWQAALSFATDAPLDLSPRELAAAHLIAVTAYGRVRLLLGGRQPAVPKLTPREREVLTWAAAGKSAWETSCILGVGERTVITHLENIRQKLNAANTTQAVATALRNGELQPY